MAIFATSSCHSRVRRDSALSEPRDITRALPVSTSNASIQPAEIGGSANANALSISTTKTSCVELTCASSFSTSSGLSKRKSEMIGTIDVFRMKPESVMLSVSARRSGCVPVWNWYASRQWITWFLPIRGRTAFRSSKFAPKVIRPNMS